jgi:uncharacterized lipoprotein NlpE involved in copper resistance
MKKYIILLLLATVSFTFTACDNETEPGGTAVEKMAGTWYVTWEQKCSRRMGRCIGRYGGIEHL